MGRVSKILIADDSNVAQRMGKEILVAEGYEVLTVNNGHTALKKVSEFAPDLILADIFMPGASGYELCQSVRTDPKFGHIPIVLMVGAMEPYDKDEARRVGADGILTKPLQSTDVVVLVSDLLAPSRDRIADEQDDVVAEETPHVALNETLAVVEMQSKQEVTTVAPQSITEETSEQLPEQLMDTESVTESEVDSRQPVQESHAEAGPLLSVFQELMESPEQVSAAQEIEAASPIESESATTALLTVQGIEDTPVSPIVFPLPESAEEVEPVSELPIALEFSTHVDEADHVESSTTAAATEAMKAEADTGFSVPAFPEALSQLERSISQEAENNPQASSSSSLAVPEFMSTAIEEVAVAESQQSTTEEVRQELVEESEQAEPESSLVETLQVEPEDDVAVHDVLTSGIAWTAEAVEVTEADRNLFEKAFPDWDGLAKLVHGGAVADDMFDYSQKKSDSGSSASESAMSESVFATALEDDVEPLVLETPSQPFLVEHRQTGGPVLELDPVPESRQFSSTQNAIDPSTLNQMIRDSVESMLPEIVDRIVSAVESALLKPQS